MLGSLITGPLEENLAVDEVVVPTNSSLTNLIDPKLYLDSANTFTGKLKFNLPLITFEHRDGSTTGAHLIYNPLQKGEEQTILGCGWGIAKNCINYDPKTREYSITLQGTSFSLKPQPKTGQSKTIPFSIADSSLTILHPTDAKFQIFHPSKARQTYENNHSLKEGNCWLLTEEMSSEDSKVTYSYDIINDEAYLRNINHSDGIQFLKMIYKTDDLFFKLISVEMHTKQQPPAFFKTALNDRQLSFTETEGRPFVRFDYHETEKNLVRTVALPRLNISFSYDNQDVSGIVSAQSYSIQGQNPRIFYGNNYFIGAHIDVYGALAIEKCDPTEFEIEASSNVGYSKRFPSLTIGSQPIQNYSILPLKDHIVILISGEASGKIYLFNSEISTDSSIFQDIVASWDVACPGTLHAFDMGFYFTNKDGCRFYYQQDTKWVFNQLTKAVFPIISEGEKGWVYTDDSLLALNDLTQPLQTNKPIEGAKKNWLGEMIHSLSIISGSERSLHAEFVLLAATRMLSKSENYLALSSLVMPSDMNTPIRTKLQLFDVSDELGKVLITQDNRDYFYHKSFADLSAEIFGNDIVGDIYTYRRHLYFDKNTKTIRLRTRNITIFPDQDFLDKNIQDIPWEEGVSYKLIQPIHLKNVISGEASRHDQVHYHIQKQNGQYNLHYENPDLLEDLKAGKYTFQLDAKSNEKNTIVFLKPASISDHEIVCYVWAKGETAQKITANPENKYKGIYEFIRSLYINDTTFNEQDFSNLIEKDEDLPRPLSLIVADYLLSYLAEVDREGCITTQGWRWVTTKNNEKPQLTKELKISDDYSLSLRDNRVCLVTTKNNTSVFQFPVDSIEKIFNYFPSCLIYQNDDQVEMLCFKPADSPEKPPEPDPEQTIFKKGTFVPASSWPANPYFTVAIQNGKDESDDSVLSVNRVPELLKNLIGNDFVITEQTVQTSQTEETSKFAYRTPWQFQESQLVYRIVEKIPLDRSLPQGKSSTVLSENSVTNKIYNQDGTLVKYDKESTQDQPTIEETSGPDFSSPITLTSNLKSFSGGFIIAQIKGVFFEDQEADFLSFESYETGRIGAKSSSWTLKDGTIREGWSLSGRQFLSLNPMGEIKASYSPNECSKIFSAGVWVRSDRDPKSYSPLSMQYTAQDYQLSAIGEIKNRQGSWVYYEAILPLGNQINLPIKGNLTVLVNAGNGPLDVDNIRFSPLGAPLKARVFDPDKRTPSHVFNSKGLCQRLIYAGDQLVAITRHNGTLHSLFSKWNSHFDLRLEESLMPQFLMTDLTIQPNNGFCEDGNPSKIDERWKLDKNAWQLAPYSLTHRLPSSDRLTSLFSTSNPQCMGCFFTCQELSTDTLITLHFQNFYLELHPYKWSSKDLPVSILALRNGSRLLVFANGQLILDEIQTPNNNNPVDVFALDVQGTASLNNLMLFDQPKVVLQYKNFKGQAIQSLILVNENQALINLSTYDDLGRTTSNSLPQQISEDEQHHLMTFRTSFPTSNPVQNFTYEQSPLADLQKSDFSNTEYDGHPSQILRGNFAAIKKLIPELIEQLRPWLADEFMNKNHRYVVTKDSDGVYSITILNKETQPIAVYRQIKTGFIQNQFAYQKDQLQTQKLPRQFVLEPSINPSNNLNSFERSFDYTSDGQLRLTKDPDYGTDLMVHDQKSSALRFQAHINKEGLFSYLLVFDYDSQGCINFAGIHTQPKIQFNGQPINLNEKIDLNLLETALKNISSFENVPEEAQQLILELQKIHTSNVAQESAVLRERGCVQSICTNQTIDADAPIQSVGNTQEFFEHDLNGAITRKKRVVNGYVDFVGYEYDAQSVMTTLHYPTEIAPQASDIVYDRDHLGRITSIHTADNKMTFAKFEYKSGTSMIAREELPLVSIDRQFLYNATYQLSKIEDDFLSQELNYTKNSFQESTSYKQLVSSTTSISKWALTADDQSPLKQLKEKLGKKVSGDIDGFLNALIKGGYLNENGFVTKSLELDAVYDLPIYFDLTDVIPILQQHPAAIPSTCQYSYEFADQLSKAKFSQQSPTSSLRFSPTAIQEFSTKPNIYPFSQNGAVLLYNKLRNNNYVTADGIWDLSITEQLESAVNNGEGNGVGYMRAYPISVRNLLLSHYLESIPLSLLTWKSFFQTWSNSQDIMRISNEATEAWNWLIDNKFLTKISDSKCSVNDSILSSKILELSADIKDLQISTIDVVNLIHFFQRNAIGKSANDVWVFGEDAHGNMSNYYVGNSRFCLDISSTSNQVVSLTTNFSDNIPDQLLSFSHDANGNVVCAPHKRIKAIHYNLFSNRPEWIEMEDGSHLQFSYDSKGQRSFKRVEDNQKNWKEVRYLRDETGCVIAEWHTSNESSPKTYSFIYGPTGLVGFVLNGNYYAVLKDHEGSIRIIVNNQRKVVFATDYLPYGQKTQTFGDTSLLSYGYLGQEFDQELGLYNFNARLYDPELGRFYQVDPARQYASPYIYAGNSPISYRDPTGLFSWKNVWGGFISTLEIVAGLGITIFTAGVEAEGIGGALMGAGTNGLFYSIESGDHFSWKKFGEEEGIGAAIGALTAGLGCIEGSIAEKVVADLAENSLKRFAAEAATKFISRSLTGIVTGAGQTILENMANGKTWYKGLDQAVWMGALTGSISAALGTAGEKFGRSAGLIVDDAGSSKIARGIKSFALGVGSGFAGDALGALTVNAITGQPLDTGLWQTAIGNVVGGVSAAGHSINPKRPLLISRGLKFEEVNTKTNCLAKSIFTSLEKQGLLKLFNISTEDDLRAIASDEILNLKSDSRKFKDMLEKYIDSDATKGLSQELDDLVREVREEKLESSLTSREILDERLKDQAVEEYIDRYAKDVKDGKVWGSFLELECLSKKLNLKFRIDIKGEDWGSIGSEDALASVFLRYSGDHYDVYHKQGISFLNKRRIYRPIEDEHGFGSGKDSPKNMIKGILKKYPELSGITKSLDSKGVKIGVVELLSESVCDTLTSRRKFLISIDMIDNGNTYQKLFDNNSIVLLVESHHIVAKSISKRVFNDFGIYSANALPSLSMLKEDHRPLGSTGSGPLQDKVYFAVKDAIYEANKINPKIKIPSVIPTTAKAYHDYMVKDVAGAVQDKQDMYTNMMDVEMRHIVKLYDGEPSVNGYRQGLTEGIDIGLDLGFFNLTQSTHLKSILI